MSTYIFDFDGTLGDSMPFFTEGMLEILNKHEITYSADMIKIITPLGYKGTAKYYIEEFGLPYTAGALGTARHEDGDPIERDEIELKPGVVEYLNKLRKKGHSLNVLTASPFKMVAAVLMRYGVFDLFDNVWSCEDFDMTKGEPEIYHAAVERAGGKLEDSYFFDDNLEAVKTAVNAGIYTIGVYDKASDDYVEEIKKTANKFIYNFDTDIL